MAAASNGGGVKPGQKLANGNGNTNGYTLSSNPSTTSGKTTNKPVKPKKGFSLLSIISRILTWYSIITIFFRCPATVDLITDSSPRICKPYFQLQSAITPHLQPYYETYAAPYVDTVRPYYQTLDKQVIAPATAFGIKYGAPRVTKGQEFAQAQWDKNVQPFVAHYQNIAKAKYDEALAPHLDKATKAVGPYYDIAKTNALQTYYGHILPTYTTVQPYAVHGYVLASDFIVTTAIPYSQWAWTTGGIFLDRTVFPKLRVLYGENVEPQLVRIGERLGRYRDGKKLKAAIDNIDSSSSSVAATSTFFSISSSIAAAHETPTLSSTSVETEVASEAAKAEEPAEPTKLTSAEIRENAAKVVAEDLKTWQEKFSRAADLGSEELESRITEITDRMIQSQAEKVGRALNIQLEETVKSSLGKLKSDIISIVKGSASVDEKEESLNAAVRKAGVAIKDKAQSIRTWRLTYNKELNMLIGKAAKETFEIIDHIRDLGLQEVGMRWAWLDGVTHKDWAKYHELKNKFDEWRVEVEQVSNAHPGLAKARATAQEVESNALDTAELAAKELSRTKETGRWKISTSDASEDWSPKIVPVAAANSGPKILEKASDASEAVLGTSQGTVESILSEASSTFQSVGSSISSNVIGTPQGSVEAIVSIAKESATSLADEVSSSVIRTSQGSVESVISVAKGTVSSLVDAAAASVSSATSDIVSGSSSLASSVSKSDSEASDSISSVASSASSAASKKVWGGAEAQFVEARQIIFDEIIQESDEDTFSEKIQSMASAAGDRFADITNAVSEAILQPTRTGVNVETVTVLAAEKYSSALSAASVALYGTQQGSGENISSLVSSRYADAIAAASNVIYGTPTPVAQSISAQASEAYNRAVSQAAENYEQARSLLSARISGTPKPVHEELYSSAESVYSHATLDAKSRFDAALSGASTAIYGTSTGSVESLYSFAASVLPTTSAPSGAIESISALASSRLVEGVSAAKAQFDEAKSYLSAVQTRDAAKQKLFVQMQNQYYAGVGMAYARYSDFLEAASSAIAPTQTATAWTDSVVSAASENWESLVTKASEQIYGQPTPYFMTRRLLSEAREYADSATEVVGSQYTAMASIVSELIIGKEPDFTESVFARLSSAYYTGAGEFASSATTYASEAYATASSVVASVFTPPPALEEILKNASLKVNEAVELASIQLYGSQKGVFEKATASAASAYSSATSVASENIYGTQTGYAEAAQASIADAAASAHRAISEAIYGAQTGTYESVTSVVADTLSSATSVIGNNIAAASSAISTAIYGPEQGAIESAQARLSNAIASARAKLEEFAAAAGEGASDTMNKASAGVEDFASSVSEAISSVTAHVKDEL
ncbi:hypothetical protein B0O99DRAFT_74902 [Bisporella sp. PMI_857]|nr:hypothetical protein B0O99DRAFT_74902 [Bisporella sp. PMI_857]